MSIYLKGELDSFTLDKFRTTFLKYKLPKYDFKLQLLHSVSQTDYLLTYLQKQSFERPFICLID